MSEQKTINPPPRFTRSFETQKIIERLEKLDIGEQVSYEELAVEAGLSRVSGSTGSLHSARHFLQRTEGRVFACVPGIGVKRATDAEIVQTGSMVVQHIHRTARRGMLRLACANFDVLSPEQRMEFNEKASHLAILQHVTTAKSAKRIGQAVAKSQAKLPVEATLAAFQNGKD